MYRVSCPIIYNINILLDQEREIIIWAVPKKVPMIYIPRLGTLERERERERERSNIQIYYSESICHVILSGSRLLLEHISRTIYFNLRVT